jgi:hypothetical protein
MFAGEKIEARLRIGNLKLLIYLPNTMDVKVGDELVVSIPWRNTIVLPLETETE